MARDGEHKSKYLQSLYSGPHGCPSIRKCTHQKESAKDVHNPISEDVWSLFDSEHLNNRKPQHKKTPNFPLARVIYLGSEEKFGL